MSKVRGFVLVVADGAVVVGKAIGKGAKAVAASKAGQKTVQVFKDWGEALESRSKKYDERVAAKQAAEEEKRKEVVENL